MKPFVKDTISRVLTGVIVALAIPAIIALFAIKEDEYV
jgi:hypothetical protein